MSNSKNHVPSFEQYSNNKLQIIKALKLAELRITRSLSLTIEFWILSFVLSLLFGAWSFTAIGGL